MKMKESLRELRSLIRSGVKIVNIDIDNQEIKFIECVIVQDSETKPFFISIPIEEGDEFQAVMQSKRFRDSLFAPKDRAVLLIDVAGYSRYDTLYQSSVLSLFNQAFKYSLKKLKRLSGSNCLEQIIPTGDGCFVIFNECVNDYLLKAAYILFSEMNKMQDKLIGKFSEQPNLCEKMYLRFSVTIGQTDFFYDPTGKRNCYGTGMNEAERILSLGRDRLVKELKDINTVDSFLIHGNLYEQAKELLEVLRLKGHVPELVDLGIVTDKHGLKRPISWLHHLPLHEEISL